jgi:hypothetical protein
MPRSGRKSHLIRSRCSARNIPPYLTHLPNWRQRSARNIQPNRRREASTSRRGFFPDILRAASVGPLFTFYHQRPSKPTCPPPPRKMEAAFFWAFHAPAPSCKIPPVVTNGTVRQNLEPNLTSIGSSKRRGIDERIHRFEELGLPAPGTSSTLDRTLIFRIPVDASS